MDSARQHASSVGPPPPGVRAARSREDTGAGFTLGEDFDRQAVEPYTRKPGDPLYRPLRIYTVDPSLARFEGAIATLDVPYEPLAPGPSGCLFEMDCRDGATGREYRAANLDELGVSLSAGYAPSLSDPRFHQQMVYAVSTKVYHAFRTALGRNPSWGFGHAGRAARLVLKPHACVEANAFYDRGRDGATGTVCFGYYRADDRPTDRTLPGGYVFTCLSHDVIAHEITHAILDGMRAKFCIPTSPDVPAFHEAFADLIAIFQRFSYRDVLVNAINASRGELAKAPYLVSLAYQFGNTTGKAGPLRTAIDASSAQPRQYDQCLEPHALGSVLVSAFFEAFLAVFRRKTEPYLRLATSGTGVPEPGALPSDLQTVLARKANALARQFLSICIRAIDYCPPVSITFGEYLRALITADHDLVPDDPWDYRGAFIDAFRRRNIYPRGVSGLSEDALRWSPPGVELAPIDELDFASLPFRGDPARVLPPEARRTRARALGRFLLEPAHRRAFGLAANGDARLGGDAVDDPCIESLRVARRASPDGEVLFDLVAEVTQQRHVHAAGGRPGFTFHGGGTIILGPDGRVRYTITKNVASPGRAARRAEFIASATGQRYWAVETGGYAPRGHMFRITHEAGAGGR